MSLRISAEAFAAYRRLRGAIGAGDVPGELDRAHFVRVNSDGSELWRLPRAIAGQRLRLTVRDGEVFAVHPESASGAAGDGRGSRARRNAARSAAHKARLAVAGLSPAGAAETMTDMAARKATNEPAPKRVSGPSGRNKHPGRMLHQPEEAWSEQDAAARAEGVSWAEWIRDAAARKLRNRRP